MTSSCVSFFSLVILLRNISLPQEPIFIATALLRNTPPPPVRGYSRGGFIQMSQGAIPD